MKLHAFTKENLVDLELRRTRSKALEAIANDWPSAPRWVERYNRQADNWNNLHPAYPLGKV